MNTVTSTASDTTISQIVLVAFMGVMILFIAGFANVSSLHDTAHDMRHAIGFACH